MMDETQEALKRRRGRGLDISILVGDAAPVQATIPMEAIEAAMAGNSVEQGDPGVVEAEPNEDSMEEKEQEKNPDLAPELPEKDKAQVDDKGAGLMGALGDNAGDYGLRARVKNKFLKK